MVTRNRKKEKPYLERDISWMYFNRRILQEATRSHVPLLERMAFLGIYSNNLDEFFRVRVASQSRIAECMDKSAAKEREKAKKLLKQIGKLNARYVKDYEEAVSSVTEDLKKENIYLVSNSEVTPEQLQFIQSFYKALNPQLHSRSATYIKRNGLLIRKITIKSSRPFQCAYHPLTP